MSDGTSREDSARRLEITEADLAAADTQTAHPPAAAAPGDSSTVTAPIPSARPFAPRAEGGADQDWTEATRLMCTAAYLDPTFAQDVVDEIVHERHRAIQIPTGVDIATVAKHCLAAC